jgi:xanthine dehydrogenase accessory factor
MKDVIEQVDRWVARGDRVALATVVGVKRSGPRPPGSKMAINDPGEVYGADLARVTGWRPYVIDPRARFATRERFPDAIDVIVAWPEPAFEQLGGIDRATYLAILTHDPKIDDEVLRLALSAEPAYIGAMGSKRAQAERRERLLALGVNEADLSRISAPIGLDLGALSREEIALSIMAELVAVRYGRDCTRLVQQRQDGSIH